MDQDAKRRALDEALKQIEKDFGKGAVMKLGDPSNMMSVETTPTGSLSLDLALGLGGIPKGRIIEVYGPESSGKTTVALHMVAEVQKRGGIAGFIDAEHALDPVYAKNIGVDVDNLYISQPDTGEQALEITETMVRSGAVDIIIVDSVAALVPKAEIEGDMGDLHVGLQARLMSQALRKLTSIVSNTNSTVVFINQLREKIGVMFGSPETTTGGRALKFYSSVRLEVLREFFPDFQVHFFNFPPVKRKSKVLIGEDFAFFRAERKNFRNRHTSASRSSMDSALPAEIPVVSTGVSPCASRTRFSISTEISGCSCRKPLAFSRPCPILLPS